jgi:hypothetical protein
MTNTKYYFTKEEAMVGKASGWQLSVVGLLAALLVAGVAQAHGTKENGKLQAFRKELERKNFIVQEGSVTFPPILQWCCQCELPSCYGNNASSTYGLFALPPAPNQDPAVKNPYAEWFTEKGNLPEDWSYWWRMRPDEAVVFLLPTPPKVDYFGFTAYIYDRYVPNLPKGAPCTHDGETREQPDSALHRYPVYTSLGDTVNPMTINVAGGRKDPYEKEVAFIMAADRKTEHKVRDALIAAGYPEKSINFLPVSPSLARLGLESEDDTLSLLLRVAPTVSSYISVPKTLLRVSPAALVPPEKLDPIPPSTLRVRGTGKTEVSLLPALDALEQVIVAKYPGHTARTIRTINLPEGYNCLENFQNCFADNRDTIYIMPGYNINTFQPFDDLTLEKDSGEFYIAYGVIHPEVNKATYSNISVMGWGRRAAPVMVSNQDMAGSARYYLGSDADPATVDKIYAFKIARLGGCSGQSFCKEIGFDCDTGIASDEDIALIFRAYVEPATKVGPALGEVILDRILRFTPKP